MSIESRIQARLTQLVQRDYGGDTRRLFNDLDPRGQGLDANQIKGLLDRAGVSEFPVSNSYIARQLLDRFDTSRDRRIQWQEFANGRL